MFATSATKTDRIEILAIVERQIGVERRIGGKRGGVVQDRIAVGSSFGDDLFADRAAGAAAIPDRELLPEILTQLGVKNARRGVGAAGGGIRHRDANRPFQPI
jgi:hypothetical protein